MKLTKTNSNSRCKTTPGFRTFIQRQKAAKAASTTNNNKKEDSMNNSNEMPEYVGKTLKEVKALHPNVRVMKAGNVGFVGTADYRLDRLNVYLGTENLKFSVKTLDIGGHSYSIEEVDDASLENGIVERAYVG